jgi:hypothetical protein
MIVCVRACVRVCVRARVCVYVRVCVHMPLWYTLQIANLSPSSASIEQTLNTLRYVCYSACVRRSESPPARIYSHNRIYLYLSTHIHPNIHIRYA